MGKFQGEYLKNWNNAIDLFDKQLEAAKKLVDPAKYWQIDALHNLTIAQKEIGDFVTAEMTVYLYKDYVMLHLPDPVIQAKAKLLLRQVLEAKEAKMSI